MIAENTSLTDLLEKISLMETGDDIRQITQAKNRFLDRATSEEVLQLRDAIGKRNAELLELTRRESDEA